MEWISVKDRLPDAFQVVLTYGKARAGRQITLAHYNDYWRRWLSNTKTQRQITHWMPLPEPPKL